MRSAPPLIRHGEHVKPHYVPAPGEVDNWAGISTDGARPDGNDTGIVKRYGKRAKAREIAVSLGLISKASTDAVLYTSPSEIGLRGLAMISGLLGASIAIGGVWHAAPDTYFWPINNIFDIPLWFAPPIFLAAGITLLLWTVRLELFQPIDEPTIFNRKHRKVYRIFCEAQPGWKGLFKPWPMRACEYDWDLIDAEHNATLVTTGSTIRREHTLIFIVRKSPDDPTIIDSFNIGNGLFAIDDAVDAAWEHIRRFMEDNGPPLPHGETLPQPTPRKGFWARVRNVSPLSRQYWVLWREQLPMMLLLHVVFPLTIVFGGLWLFFGWLAVKTSKPIEWPPEVVAAVGSDVAAPTSNRMV